MTLFDAELPPPVDMHCHLSDAGGYSSVEGNALLVAVTNDPLAWRALQATQKRANTAWAVGLHPCELRDDDNRVRLLIDALADAPAIGEVGLDYSRRARASRVSQRSVLDEVLAQPAAKDRVVTLHSVGATSDIVAAVETHAVRGAVLHWFLGSPAEVERAIAHDVYFSVNSAMFRSGKGRAAIAEMPPNRVLVETDAPYARAGPNPTKPGQVDSVERSLARSWNLDPREVRNRLWQNFLALQNRVHTQLFTQSKE